MAAVSVLRLSNAHRPGGGGKTERHFWELEVDGVSLLVRLGWKGADLISPLGSGSTPAWPEALEALRREKPPQLQSGRVLLYVCPECGDVGCGAIAARITREGDHVLWSDFAHENGYEAPESISGVPIIFDAQAYWHAFDSCEAAWRSSKSFERTRGR